MNILKNLPGGTVVVGFGDGAFCGVGLAHNEQLMSNAC